MGQKIKPIGLRLGINRTWDSRWYADTNYADLLHEDRELRSHLMEKLKAAAISRVVIERPAGRARITLYAGRPGLIIGKKGSDIENLKQELMKRIGNDVSLNIVEVRKPEIDAKLVAESIAQQLERRIAFRRAMKRSVQSAMRLGAKGVRINCAGRLGGAEIARTEWYREGRVPLHTLRADIDYGEATAHTTYGTCGVKVWVFKDEIFEHDPMAQDKRMAGQQAQKPPRAPDQQLQPAPVVERVQPTRRAGALAQPGAGDPPEAGHAAVEPVAGGQEAAQDAVAAPEPAPTQDAAAAADAVPAVPEPVQSGDGEAE